MVNFFKEVTLCRAADLALPVFEMEKAEPSLMQGQTLSAVGLITKINKC